MKGQQGFIYVLITENRNDSPKQANKFLLDLNDHLARAFKSAGTGSTSIIVEKVLSRMFDQTPQANRDQLDDMEQELHVITSTMSDNLN